MCGCTSKHRGPCACGCHSEAWEQARPGFRESVQLTLSSGLVLMADITTVKAHGRTHEIPGIWIAGFCQGNRGATALDAINWWIYQSDLEALEAAE